jgi:hypothetical protein
VYTDSITFSINITATSTFTQDIQLQRCTSGGYTCGFNQQFVQFIVTDYFMAKRYSGVTINVYEGLSTITPMFTAVTGTDGSVTIQLVKDKQYTVTAINSVLGINEQIITIPVSPIIYIRTSLNLFDWHTQTNGYDVNTEISTIVTSSVINTTSAYINVSYNDSLSQTSNLMFYLNTSVSSDPLNQTILQSHSGGSSASHNYSFIVSGYTCVNYFVTVRSTHATFGTYSHNYGVTFPGMCNASGLNPTLLYYFGIALLIFIGGMAGATSSTQIGGVVVFMGWVLQGFGWISGVNTSAGLTAGLTLATIFIAVSMMNDRAKNEGVA